MSGKPSRYIYSAAEVAQELGRAARTVRQEAAAHRCGKRDQRTGHWRFCREDVELLRGLKGGRPRKMR